MDEIARRSGVTVPVVYEHFESKQQLHRRLLPKARACSLITSKWPPRMDGPPAPTDD
jgi:Bacterial regulatory proteins, tetR family